MTQSQIRGSEFYVQWDCHNNLFPVDRGETINVSLVSAKGGAQHCNQLLYWNRQEVYSV